jgi:TolB-like protein/Flp pilus assembly protein TadD
VTAGPVYEFGRFRLDAEGPLLFEDGERVALPPKAVDVLLTLVERRGTAVSRQELLAAVWMDAVVEEGTLSSHISLLRKTLGRQFIETIPKRGYRFVGKVEERAHAPQPERILLAVLPFENLSGNRKYDSFSDGLTEEMITQLGRANPQRLGVIARTSAMTYKSTDKTIEQIGRELGVTHALEGSVRRAANRVRIAAQLILVSDQTHLWADSYESLLEDILGLQSKVSRVVAEQIQIKLMIREETRRVVPAAYEATLKGRYLWNRRSEQDLQSSIRHFREAIDVDPAYAAAYTGIAESYLSLMDLGSMSLTEASEKVGPLLVKSLELDEDLPETHVALGHVAIHRFDWPAAERELLRGLELNPNSSIAHFYYSNYLTAMGRLDEAVLEAEQTVQLDPVSPAAISNLSWILWHARRAERAIDQARKALDLHPEFSPAYHDLGRGYELMGDFDAAIEAFRKGLAIEDDQTARASLAYALAVAGRRDEALEILRQLQDEARTTFISAYNFAVLYVGLGDKNEAFAWLDKACEERASLLPCLKVNPRLDSISADPRFEKVAQRVGLP